MTNQENDNAQPKSQAPFMKITYTLEMIGPTDILNSGELTISDMELLIKEKKCISRCDYYNEEPLTGPEVVALMNQEEYDAYSDYAEPSNLGLNEDGSPIVKPYIVTIPYHYYRQFRVSAPNEEIAKEIAYSGDVPHYAEDTYNNNEVADVEEA